MQIDWQIKDNDGNVLAENDEICGSVQEAIADLRVLLANAALMELEYDGTYMYSSHVFWPCPCYSESEAERDFFRVKNFILGSRK